MSQPFSKVFLVLFFSFQFATAQDLLLEVRSFKIEGNEKTKDSYILREMTFALGDTVSLRRVEKLVKRSEQNITNLNLFIAVAVNTTLDSNKLDVVITVKERLYLLPLPIFYLADRSFNEWWYDRGRDFRRTTYGIQLNHANLTGNGDELKVKAYAGFIPYFELSYGKPYIDKRQRMGIRGGVFYSTQKTIPFRTWNDKLDFLETEVRTRVRKGAFVQYNLRNALYHFHTIRLGLTSLSVNDSIKLLNPNYVGDNGNELDYFSMSYEYRLDYRDNFQYPLKGQVFLARLNKFGLGIFDDANQLDISLLYNRYFALSKKVYFDFGLSSKVSFPKLQLYPFTRGFGYGENFVRGYQLNVIDGQDFGLFKSNLKYKVFSNEFDLSKFLKFKQFSTLPVATFAKLFADIGYVNNDFPQLSNSTLSNKVLWGGGIGLDVVTFYNSALDINYSINQQGRGRFFFSVQRNL